MPDLLEKSPVTGGEIVYRRVPDMSQVNQMVDVEDAHGVVRRRPSSANFKLSRHEDGLSVYRHDVLREYRLDAHALLKKPLSGVVSLRTSAVREEGLDVEPDPWPEETDDPNHDRNAAHALITGLRALSRSQQQRKADTLAKQAVVVIDPTRPAGGAPRHPS